MTFEDRMDGWMDGWMQEKKRKGGEHRMNQNGFLATSLFINYYEYGFDYDGGGPFIYFIFQFYVILLLIRERPRERMQQKIA